jgi:hypothetical protein
MVSRASAVGCHRLREVPSLQSYSLLLQSGHGHWSQPQPVHAWRIMQRLYRGRTSTLLKPAHPSWAIESSVKRGAGVVGWSQDAVHDRHRAAADDDAIAVQFDADQS